MSLNTEQMTGPLITVDKINASQYQTSTLIYRTAHSIIVSSVPAYIYRTHVLLYECIVSHIAEQNQSFKKHTHKLQFSIFKFHFIRIICSIRRLWFRDLNLYKNLIPVIEFLGINILLVFYIYTCATTS